MITFIDQLVISIYKDRIVFAAHDGNFYYTNKIDDLKRNYSN